MILHFSHIGLTDGRTFMIPFGSMTSDLALAAAAGRRYQSRTRARRRDPAARRSRTIAKPSGPSPRPTGTCDTRRSCLASVVLVPGREDARAVGRDGDRELEVRGQRAVLREDRPAVVAHADLMAPGVDHRLDGQDHPLLEDRAAARIAE